MNPQQLITKAQKTSKNAYSPYSQLKVGAALITEKGNIYTGCNIENASYGLTSCAERNAIATAVNAEGPKMKIKLIAVAVNNKQPISPCGACRQVISEFSTAFTDVLFYDKKELLIKKINSLLPDKFVF